MKNFTLQITFFPLEESTNHVDSFRGIKTVERAQEVLANRQKDNIKRADYKDGSGTNWPLFINKRKPKKTNKI